MKGRTKLTNHEKIVDWENQMNYMRRSNTFMFEEDTFAKNVQKIGMIMHEALWLRRILPTEPLTKS